MNKKIRLLSGIIALLQVVSIFSGSGFIVFAEKTNTETYNTLPLTEEHSANEQFPDTTQSVEIELAEKVTLQSGKTEDFIAHIENSGAYNLVLFFKPCDESTQSISYSVKLDGVYPFSQAEVLRADCIYENSGEITCLSTGDQIAPEIRHISDVMQSTAYDITGVELEPLKFSLTAGYRKISITTNDNSMILYGIKLVSPEKPISYKEYFEKNRNKKNYIGEQILIEGESAVRKNSYSVGLRSDTESPNITPLNPTASYLNYIGGTTWNESGQEIVWQLDVPNDGLYKIGASFNQSTVINGYTYRILKIDGKVPFKEAEAIPFDYSINWQFKSFADSEGNDYLFYLSKGIHTISLTVTLADVAEVFKKLEVIVEGLGKTYIDMVMITGETPDSNRDYELHKQIPDFKKKLCEYKDSLDALSHDVKNKYRVNGELDGTIMNMSRVLGEMTSNLYSSHLYISSYYSYYQTLCSWLYDIKNMTLSIDKIIVAAPNKNYETGRPNFFGKAAFHIKRFIFSFSGDYHVTSLEDKDAVTLKLWVNWGRDQVKVLNSLIRQSFSSNTGINVRVEQVNASLVQGVISNNSPDLYLHLSRTEPVNLAMRGVIYDLTNFDDYNEVIKNNFIESAEEPYIYENGVYALPDTQSFNVLFYRTDIMEQLGLTIPKTWQEFLDCTAIIQRKNMNVCLPYTKITAATTVNTGAGGLNIFPTMLLQKGGSLYNSTYNATDLANPISVSTFTFWTDFYKKYSLDAETNFYQRFRVGTIPLGIAAYTQYLTFAVAAPEIEGKWAIAEIPGFEDENGNISNLCAGAGSGCVIMRSSKAKKEAWEFLKWWVSADTQYEYSANVEAILGESGRVSTSNVNALSRLSWDKSSLNVILSQWKKVKEIREVPGSYYVSRSIDQAFWAVYNDIATPKEAITDWSKTSNSEIKRKIAEYAGKKFD